MILNTSLAKFLIMTADACYKITGLLRGIHTPHGTGRFQTMPDGIIRYHPVPCVKVSSIAMRCPMVCLWGFNDMSGRQRSTV